MYFLMKECITATVLARECNQDLTKQLDSVAHLQEMQKTKKYAKLWKTLPVQFPRFFKIFIRMEREKGEKMCKLKDT